MTSTARILTSGIAGIALVVGAGVGAFALARLGPDLSAERAALVTAGPAWTDDAPRHGPHRVAPRLDHEDAVMPDRDADREADRDRDRDGDGDGPMRERLRDID